MASFTGGGGGWGAHSLEPPTHGAASQAPTFTISEETDVITHHNNLYLCFTCLSKEGKEVRIKVTRIVVKVDGKDVWEEVTGFKINSGSGYITRIDLDPNETRYYSIFIETPGDKSFEYELSASDGTGFQFVLRGRRKGVDLAEMPKPSEKALGNAHITIGRIVRIIPTLRSGLSKQLKLDQFYPEGSFVISPGSLESQGLGIFANDNHQFKSYIALGHDGYKELVGQFTTALEWDRDTVACPPADLTAVHIASDRDATKQGWVMKTDLLYDDTTATTSSP
jgi:hypothetical protein